MTEPLIEWEETDRITKLRNDLQDFVKYVGDKTQRSLGYNARGRLEVKGKITYLSIVFTVILDSNRSEIRFPKSEEIIEKSVEFEKLFKVVLGRVIRVMLEHKKGFNVEYRGQGEIEFTEITQKTTDSGTIWHAASETDWGNISNGSIG